MQINRLFEIVYLLLEKNTITAKELAEHFSVSTRTIYRDIDILSTASIPIYTNKGKGGGIALLDNFVLDKSLLSDEEQNQILFALQSLEKLAPNEENKILDKVGMLFSKQATEWIAIDFSNWGEDTSQNIKFNQIKEAILKKQVLEIIYYNSYGKESKRKIEPLQIYFKDKSWYLKAYCREKKEYRLFKISRIKEIFVLGENLKRELPIIEPKEERKPKIISLTLEISKKMPYRVYDEFDKKNIKKKK